jgi:hypothetical protein
MINILKRTNRDVMEESYMVEEYPHVCGDRVHSLVEYLTSLEDTCFVQLYL